jgi:hypothetical protein
MILHRMKNNVDSSYERPSQDWKIHDGKAVVDFPKFGHGTERNPDFRVTLTWQDVEEIVDALANKKHEKALRAQKAFRLAGAIEDLVKISS